MEVRPATWLTHLIDAWAGVAPASPATRWSSSSTRQPRASVALPTSGSVNLAPRKEVVVGRPRVSSEYVLSGDHPLILSDLGEKGRSRYAPDDPKTLACPHQPVYFNEPSARRHPGRGCSDSLLISRRIGSSGGWPRGSKPRLSNPQTRNLPKLSYWGFSSGHGFVSRQRFRTP